MIGTLCQKTSEHNLLRCFFCFNERHEWYSVKRKTSKEMYDYQVRG